MRIVSNGDNLYEMSEPVSWEKNTKKYVKMSSAEIFTQNAKREGLSTDSIEIHVYTLVRAMKAMTLLLYNIGK